MSAFKRARTPVARAVRVHRKSFDPVAFELRPTAVYTFGRATSARVLMPDPRVSRLHGRLFAKGERWVFEDTESVNGSLLARSEALIQATAESRPVAAHRMASGTYGWVRPGDAVMLGCSEAWFELLADSPSDLVPDAEVNPAEVRALLEMPRTSSLDGEAVGETQNLEAPAQEDDPSSTPSRRPRSGYA